MEGDSGNQPLARVRNLLLAAVGVAVLAGVLGRAGMSSGALAGLSSGLQGRPARRLLRVWDWWSPSTDEKYAAYFGEVEREFERLHPDVDVLFQYVPFSQYEQKMATGLVGNTPPDVFQSSVSWAEGFHDRGMLLRLNPFLERERAERERRRAAGLPVNGGEIVDREAFLESAWRHNTKPDGTVFGIPQILDAQCLNWNLDLLQKAADDPDVRTLFEQRADGSPDWDRLRWDGVRDWEHFRRVTRRLTRRDARGGPELDAKGEPVQAGFIIHAHGSGAGPFIPWLAANGSNFQDPAGTKALFADARGAQAMQYLLDLYWKDRVSPPFRRQMMDDEVFNSGRVACAVSGTWAGKYIIRNTEGRLRFDATAFPPGPAQRAPGREHTTVTWGNMLVISRRSRQPDLAWEYVKFISSLDGALRLLRNIQQNSPRRDFYETPAWDEMVRQRPYLHNVPRICASGKKLRNTQINAVDYASKPLFETILLRYPEIEKGQGPFPTVRAGLETAAAAVDRVYARYNDQVAYWHASGKL